MFVCLSLITDYFSFTLSEIYATACSEETVALGRRLAIDARPGDVWALVGDLGAGKTHFVQGVAVEMGTAGLATSPTFTLVHEYTGGRLPVFHFDFYRLESTSEALALGWEEYLDDGGGLMLVEWADKFPALLPPGARWLRFEIGEGDARRIVLE